MHVKIKQNRKAHNEFKLEIVGTRAWIMAIRTGLQIWSGQATLPSSSTTASPIAAEVLNFLDNAIQQENLEI